MSSHEVHSGGVPAFTSLFVDLFEIGFSEAVVQILMSCLVDRLFVSSGSLQITKYISHNVVEPTNVLTYLFEYKIFS
jgi:hypothetical protein